MMMVHHERSKEITTDDVNSSSIPHSNPSSIIIDHIYHDQEIDETRSTTLVTSFLQYLRHQLRTTANEKDFPSRFRPKLKDWKTFQSRLMHCKENLDDDDQIFTLIDLLVLRVDCLTNEIKAKSIEDRITPTLAEIDQNLIEFLYCLFKKFLNSEKEKPRIEKNNFVQICQRLVRCGCFELSANGKGNSNEQSTSETLSNSDPTLTEQVCLQSSDIDEENSSELTKNNNSWSLVDSIHQQSDDENSFSDGSCRLSSSILDDQLQLTSDNYRSCESECSHSLYFSPNSSFDNIQTMVQNFDEDIQRTTNSKAIVSTDDLFKETLSSTNIYPGLTNQSLSGIEMTNEQITNHLADRMARRERKLLQDRWLPSNQVETSSTKKHLMDIEFPPIAILRRKFSNKSNEKESTNGNVTTEKINASTTTRLPVDKTNPVQTDEFLSEDHSSTIDNEQQVTIISTDSIDHRMQREKEISLSGNNKGISHQATNSINPMETDTSVDSNSSVSFDVVSISKSRPIENLAIEEKHFHPDSHHQQKPQQDENEEKKNNSNFTQNDYHASRIILINDEPTQVVALLEQKKKEEEKEEDGAGEDDETEERERTSSLLVEQEQSSHQQLPTEDESPMQRPSNELKSSTMTTDEQNDELYKKVEIEDIIDDDEIQSVEKNNDIEPIDFILTDEEPRKTSQVKKTRPIKDSTATTIDPVVFCYEKALAKVVDGLEDTTISNEGQTLSTDSPKVETDPIALRALQRFEERMNAAAAKSNIMEINPLASKGKSSWSGSLSTPRKSVENLFKATEPSSTVQSTDGFIRPRKTFDDSQLNYGQTIELSIVDSTGTEPKTNEDQQLQPTATTIDQDEKREIENESKVSIDLTEQQTVQSELPSSSAKASDNELEKSSLPTSCSTDNSSMDATLMPYRLQLEGRRRLNTLERIHDRRQSRDSLDSTNTDQGQVSLVNQTSSTITDDAQDPIIRRALERFDEKNRQLTQTKAMNYDDIQDPITRRALMRLESNLKRTVHPSLGSENNENRFVNSYTLGSLQPSLERPSRSTELSSNNNTNNRTTYVSVHQRYCAPSAIDDTESKQLETQQNLPQSFGARQRSRSEDMLSSRDLALGPTTDLDQLETNNPSQIQRNRSSNQLAVNSSGLALPATLIKSLEPNFVRTTESTVSYVTPTQTYSAYSCEYTRPRRNLHVTTTSESPSASLKQETTPSITPRYSTIEHEIVRPTPYRPSIDSQFQASSPTTTTTTAATMSAFAPVRPTAVTNTTNYYQQQQPSYTAAPLQTEDPIIRRALERFNSKVQTSLMTNSQYQPNSMTYSRNEQAQDPWINSFNRLNTTNTSTNNGVGYQSIIGRRRQGRFDDRTNGFKDQVSVGNGYSSSVFSNPSNFYTSDHQYGHVADEPPAIPPRYRRDNYRIDDFVRRHSTDEYLSENINNNNNSHGYGQEAFIHHAYPATITNATSFRPINIHYNPQYDSQHAHVQEQTTFRDQTHSSLSTDSSDSVLQSSSRYQQRSTRKSPDSSQGLSDSTTANNSSVFHRSAYTGTKASLWKSNSNSCSNLLSNDAPSIGNSSLKSCEIDLDEPSMDESLDMTSVSNKYQRSKSVEGRQRLKFAQTRGNSSQDPVEISMGHEQTFYDQQQSAVPSSKFISTGNRHEVPVRTAVTHLSRPVNRPSPVAKPRNSNGNLFDSDQLEENHRTRTIPIQRGSTNLIQSSASSSSISSGTNGTRNKQPITIPIQIDRRDSNSSGTETNRNTKRVEDGRVLSPPTQRRSVPVSVFTPAKPETKRHESQSSTGYSSRSSTIEPDYFNRSADEEYRRKSALKTPTNEFTQSTDKQEHGKKMNVFERLFRGNKKKN